MPLGAAFVKQMIVSAALRQVPYLQFLHTLKGRGIEYDAGEVGDIYSTFYDYAENVKPKLDRLPDSYSPGRKTSAPPFQRMSTEYRYRVRIKGRRTKTGEAMEKDLNISSEHRLTKKQARKKAEDYAQEDPEKYGMGGVHIDQSEVMMAEWRKKEV